MRLFPVTSANIAISGTSLKTRLFGLHFRCRLCRSIFNHFDVIGPKATEFGEKSKITVIMPFKVIQGHRFWHHSKAICDFPLVINTNLHSISHRFEVITDYWSNLRFQQRGIPLWHTRSGWTPKRRITKFGHKTLETLLCRMVLKYRQTIVSFCHNLRVCQTDRRTDGQMSIASIELHLRQSYSRFTTFSASNFAVAR